jgi:hypothetical protein
MILTIKDGEFAGATIREEYVEGVFQCFRLDQPSGQFKLIPKCDGNGDYERVKKWNAENGNPLNLE